MLPPERKREVGENAEQGDKNDRRNPEFLLPRAEWLGVNAGDHAGEYDQPDNRKAKPNLPAELRGVKAESVENFAHSSRDGMGGSREIFLRSFAISRG